MEIVTLSSKGQLVIPSHVRTTANLRAGDTLAVHYIDGEIRLRPIVAEASSTLDDVAGCLAIQGKKPLTDSVLNAAIKARLKAEDDVTMSTAKLKKLTA